mgnify:CR=1 FL=1
MKKVGVAVLGLGVVGGGTCKILIDRRSQIAERHTGEYIVGRAVDYSLDFLYSVGLHCLRHSSYNRHTAARRSARQSDGTWTRPFDSCQRHR